MNESKQTLTRIDFETAIIMKAWRDEEFLRQLRANPKEAILREFGYRIVDDIEVKLLEEDDSTMYIVVPCLKQDSNKDELSDEELLRIAGGQGTLENQTFSQDSIY